MQMFVKIWKLHGTAHYEASLNGQINKKQSVKNASASVDVQQPLSNNIKVITLVRGIRE
jgi:hypothetical protein